MVQRPTLNFRSASIFYFVLTEWGEGGQHTGATQRITACGNRNVPTKPVDTRHSSSSHTQIIYISYTTRCAQQLWVRTQIANEWNISRYERVVGWLERKLGRARLFTILISFIAVFKFMV